MERKCPACDTIAVEAVVIVDDVEEWDANDTIYECQWCGVVVSLVIWDVYEDRVHAGINFVSAEDMGSTIILHMARNCDEAWAWTNERQPSSDCYLAPLNLN